MSLDGGEEGAPPNPFAFPDPVDAEQRGMPLRDYFAGQAITAIMINPRGYSASTLAEVAYQVADAMLAARVKRP